MTDTKSPTNSRFSGWWFWCAVGMVAALTGGSALLAGAFQNRWGLPEALVQAAVRVDQIPETIGAWELQSANPLPQDSVNMLQCAGHTSRTYRNRESGQIVNMFVIVGPPGPTAAHTPEICYSSRDYNIMGGKEKILLPTPRHPQSSVWALTLRGNDVRADLLDVAYAWNSGSGWEASDSPRYGYRGKPYLYKLQVAGIVDVTQPGQQRPCQDFLRELLPTLDRILLSSPEAAAK